MFLLPHGVQLLPRAQPHLAPTAQYVPEPWRAVRLYTQGVDEALRSSAPVLHALFSYLVSVLSAAVQEHLCCTPRCSAW